jgi:hypothetical protein
VIHLVVSSWQPLLARHAELGGGGYHVAGQIVEEYAPSGVAARQSVGHREVHFDSPGRSLARLAAWDEANGVNGRERYRGGWRPVSSFWP